MKNPIRPQFGKNHGPVRVVTCKHRGFAQAYRTCIRGDLDGTFEAAIHPEKFCPLCQEPVKESVDDRA